MGWVGALQEEGEDSDHREHSSIVLIQVCMPGPGGRKTSTFIDKASGRREELREQAGEGKREGPRVEQGKTLRVQAVAGDVFMLRATGRARAEG